MNRLRISLISVVVCFLLGSCMSPRQVNYLQKGHGIPLYNDTISFSDYLLQRGDYLYIKVFSLDATDMQIFNGQTANNSGMYANSGDNAQSRLYLYLINEDGTIDYPYVGKLPVVGLTLRQVKELMEVKMKDLISTFSVEVKLANKTFSVIGESRTGRYALTKEKVTIFEALAMSGDLNLYAKRQEIKVIRQTEQGTIVKTFDIRSESIINSEFYYIQPNDVIYVPFSNARFVGATTFSNVLALTFSTFSFGLLIYSIVTKLSGQ